MRHSRRARWAASHRIMLQSSARLALRCAAPLWFASLCFAIATDQPSKKEN